MLLSLVAKAGDVGLDYDQRQGLFGEYSFGVIGLGLQFDMRSLKQESICIRLFTGYDKYGKPLALSTCKGIPSK